MQRLPASLNGGRPGEVGMPGDAREAGTRVMAVQDILLPPEKEKGSMEDRGIEGG